MLGLLRVPNHLGVAEASVGAGLLVGVFDVDGDGEGGGVVGEGIGGVAGDVGRFAEAAECPGFAVPVAGLAKDGQCLPAVSNGLGGLPAMGVEGAEAVQRAGQRTVAYGACGAFVHRTFTGGTARTTAAFGTDPLAGVSKSCYLTP